MKVPNEFRVTESATGYRVELCRDGEPYVTFMDGLTRQGAEREARSLTAFWARISVRPPMGPSVPAVKSVSLDRPRTGPNTRMIGDWT